MSTKSAPADPSAIRVENVGGIEETSVVFSPGVTILVGQNATNRTSLLRGLMAALGSDNVSVKADSDEAEVELTLGEKTYARSLMRRSDGIAPEGDPYLSDSTLADLFAFLLESNEARQVVARDGDLRELIMRPIDTNAIEAEINHLTAERTELENELEELESLKDKLPNLQAERTQLQKQIEKKKSELEDIEKEIGSVDGTLEETREEKAELEETLELLREKRSEVDDVRYQLETERTSLESLQSDKEELEAEMDTLPETPTGDVDEIESRIRQLRNRKQSQEAEVNSLQNAIGFNEKMLDGGNNEVFDAIGDKNGLEDQITDQLLDDDETTCWTCGSNVATEQIESTIDHLRELSQQKMSLVNEIEEDISELQEELRELEQSLHERERIDRQLTQLEREINESENTIERLESRRETLTEEIEEVEAVVEDLEDDDHSEILDLHREANQLEFKLGRLETDLERVEENMTSIEERLVQEEEIEAQLEEVRSELENLRTRIERIEQNAIDQFNDHMEAVLVMLEYENLDRIWLERVERSVREGRQKVMKSTFELHVIRSDEGTAYEDTVDHLSESEREVVGLIFALAGYLAHEVYEQVPFMLLDSLEAIDAQRIAMLVDYFKDYTEFLIVALLPEDAAALPEAYERVTSI